MTTKFYESTKVIPLGSCAFRQPFAESHCRYIHGYRLQAKFWFKCTNLDSNNWVVDFGGLKGLKTELEETFDHTLIAWEKDPELPIFRMLHDKGVVDLRVFTHGVGIEKFAEFCLEKADNFVRKLTNNRCWCEKVEVWEHEQNSATVTSTFNMTLTTVPVSEPVKEPVTTTTDPQPKLEPVKLDTPPLHNQKAYNTFKDPFAGTSWGNSAKRTK